MRRALRNEMGQILSHTPTHARSKARASPSSPPRYDVFVSHAGEDKHTMAIPLREMLSKQGVTAFVDERDIAPGSTATEEMTSAMESADVAVIVLSPEFPAKKWPMRELLFFLHRREKAKAKGALLPVIIPVFYRLDVEDMYREPDFERVTLDGRSLYRVTRFFERRDEGEPEADIKNIRRALRTVHGIMGVVNRYRASNEESAIPSRQLLLNDICEQISKAIAEHGISTKRIKERRNTSCTERFRRHFHIEPLRDVFLDFARADVTGAPVTDEGRIKRRILNRNSKSDQIIAILGIGGVGKSTILKALVNDTDIREEFSDGIHMVSLGMDATVHTLVRELSRVLHDSCAETTALNLEAQHRQGDTIQGAVHHALRWFDKKSCLFLVDDVWTKGLQMNEIAHVVKLGCAGRQSSVVLTTRESGIASLASNRESIFKMTPREHRGAESRDILFLHAGRMRGENSEVFASGAIEGILDICAGLPVNLAAAGKGVKMMAIDMTNRDADVWTEYLKVLETCREQLLRENVGEYGYLYLTFRGSIALLEGREVDILGFETPAGFAEMHWRLCVLQKQGKAPMSMLRHLWELKNESEARVVATRFMEVGLAHCEFRIDDVWHLSIHDSIHDFALSEARTMSLSDSQLTPLQVSRKSLWLRRHRAHKILLDGYGRSHRELVSVEGGWARWWKQGLGEDWYIVHNLAYHLWNAGLLEESQQVIRAELEDTIRAIEESSKRAEFMRAIQETPKDAP